MEIIASGSPQREVQKHHSGGINKRYEVVHPEDGVIGRYASLTEAFAVADQYELGKASQIAPFLIKVFDNMASVGKPKIWQRQPKEVPVGEIRKIGKGDKETETAFWKVIKFRSEKI